MPNDGGILTGQPPLSDPLSLWFVQAVIIIGVCRFLSLVGKYMGQPRVIVEIVGGILIGPSALCRDKYFADTLFPKASLSKLGLVANIALILYLFIVGMELDPALLVSKFKKTAAIAIVGMVIPFAIGVGISPVLMAHLTDESNEGVSFFAFSIFIGTALAVTAFPVLARILKEGGWVYTEAGSMVMGAAAINDAGAWCLLVLAVSIGSSSSQSTAGYVFLTVMLFALVLLLLFRPLFQWGVKYGESLNSPIINSNIFALTICLVFICAWTTNLLGVHAIFGAFLFGLVIPRDSHLFRECILRIEELIAAIFLPLFFALSGLKTDVTQLSSGDDWLMVLLVCAAACVGKIVGAGLPAYLMGMGTRNSLLIAVFMNTRGLVELIVLNVGMEAGILNKRTFSVMVIMCLVTTFSTCPIVNYINRRMAPPGPTVGERHRLSISESRKSISDDRMGEEIELTFNRKYNFEGLHKNAKVMVVVTVLESLQELMNVISLLAPCVPRSTLSVLGVKVIEPTNTGSDRFLQPTTEGKLVETDEEAATYPVSSRFDDNNVEIKPLLFPLSMLCIALGSNVRCLQLFGNPDEFPSELNALCNDSCCDYSLMIWNESNKFCESLYFGLLLSSQSPVALLVLKKRSVDAPDGSTHAKPRSSLSLSNIQEKPQEPLQPEIAHHQALPTAGDSSDGKESEQLSSTDPNPELTNGSCIKAVLVVVFGCALDNMLLAIALRLADNSKTQVSVVTCGDETSYSPEATKALNLFRAGSASRKNVKFLPLLLGEEKSWHAAIVAQVTDLVLFSYVPPVGPTTADEANRPLSEEWNDDANAPVLSTLGGLLHESGNSRLFLCLRGGYN